ncbi:MAG: polysaccharide deacetylase family protein [Bacilli bacterium]
MKRKVVISRLTRFVLMFCLLFSLMCVFEVAAFPGHFAMPSIADQKEVYYIRYPYAMLHPLGQDERPLRLKRGTMVEVYASEKPYVHVLFQGKSYRVKRRLLTNDVTELKKKIVFLTFDDGPSIYSRPLQRIMQQRGVRGTFFYVGKRLSTYPSVVKETVRNGHTIGNHSWSHDIDRLTRSPKAYVDEMRKTDAAITALTGERATIVRSPYGTMPYIKYPYRKALNAAGYRLWDWTIDSLDWQNKGKPASILANIEAETHSGIEVLLVHESSTIVEALPEIMDFFTERNYIFLQYDNDAHFPCDFWTMLSQVN